MMKRTAGYYIRNIDDYRCLTRNSRIASHCVKIDPHEFGLCLDFPDGRISFPGRVTKFSKISLGTMNHFELAVIIHSGDHADVALHSSLIRINDEVARFGIRGGNVLKQGKSRRLCSSAATIPVSVRVEPTIGSGRKFSGYTDGPGDKT